MNKSSKKSTNDAGTASVTPTAESAVDSVVSTADATPSAAAPVKSVAKITTATTANLTAGTPTVNIPSLSARSSLVASPIVMTHADYRRPSSSVSVQSIPKAEDYGGLSRSICGTIFLFCHFLIAMVRLFVF